VGNAGQDCFRAAEAQAAEASQKKKGKKAVQAEVEAKATPAKRTRRESVGVVAVVAKAEGKNTVAGLWQAFAKSPTARISARTPTTAEEKVSTLPPSSHLGM
jgi:hypothetical protein